jgi:hypothetical protein
MYLSPTLDVSQLYSLQSSIPTVSHESQLYTPVFLQLCIRCLQLYSPCISAPLSMSPSSIPYRALFPQSHMNHSSIPQCFYNSTLVASQHCSQCLIALFHMCPNSTSYVLYTYSLAALLSLPQSKALVSLSHCYTPSSYVSQLYCLCLTVLLLLLQVYSILLMPQSYFPCTVRTQRETQRRTWTNTHRYNEIRGKILQEIS